jgi:hypothetical protein
LDGPEDFRDLHALFQDPLSIATVNVDCRAGHEFGDLNRSA